MVFSRILNKRQLLASIGPSSNMVPTPSIHIRSMQLTDWYFFDDTITLVSTLRSPANVNI